MTKPGKFAGRAHRTRIAVAAACLAALVASHPTGPAHGAALTASASPSTELSDGQYVTVNWENYPGGSNISLRQCNETPSAAQDCSSVTRVSKTRSNGKGEAIFKVETGSFPPGCSAQGTACRFVCNETTACSIGVFWGPLNDPGTAADLSKGAFTKIEFGFPLSSCPALQGTKVEGSGSSSANGAILKWEAETCRPPHSLDVRYVVKNSVDGLEDFAGGLTDFGATALPLTSEHSEVPPDSRPFTYVAASLSGVGFAYTIYDQITGEQVTNLKLTPKHLARIFTGQTLNWNEDDPNDPADIKELNPGINFPPRVLAVGSGDKSASTWYLTSWFEAVAKAHYEAGGESYRGPTKIYPSTGDIRLVTGGEKVAQEVGPRADVSAGTIGWVDTSLGAFYGLPMAAVANQAGTFLKPGAQPLT
ncbi:MAG: substrate-binding domain-containing protein, partial [Actinomycetota bacterium]